MCADCGCSIRGMEQVLDEHEGEHSHDGGKTFHSHEAKGGEDKHSPQDSSEHQKAHEHLHHNPQLNDVKTIAVIQKILDKK